MGPNTCGTSSRFFKTRMSRSPSVRRILDGSISTLLPAMRRAQVPLGISNTTSCDVDRMGASAAQAVALTAVASSTTANQRVYRMPLVLVGQQDAHVMREIVGAVPVGHQGAQAAVPIDQINVRRMIQRITAGDGYLLAHRDSVVGAYRGQLLRAAGGADKAGIKAMQELSHTLGIIPLRIHGDVEH